MDGLKKSTKQDSEAKIQQEIRLAVSDAGARTFRNNVGQFKAENGRMVSFGLCKGSSDLIGWKTVEITQEMVGKKVAVFLAIECKSFKGKPTADQLNFIRVVRESGGLAGVAKSADQAVEVINGL